LATLSGRQHRLASNAEQLRVLNNPDARQPRFEDVLASRGLHPLKATGIEVLQINVGKLCNQTCRHCHVDAGPDRQERMSRDIAELVIRRLAESDIPTLDVTGGAPELNPNFRYLITEARDLGRRVIHRSNLTVLLLPSQRDLGEFLASNQVEVIASLPCYTAERTDAQRGEKVFNKSVAALRLLNRLGYGTPGSPLRLNVVYNPAGAFLPACQEEIEADFHRELESRYGVRFHNLYAMSNMPISRFLEFLIASGNYHRYMDKLVRAFNPSAAAAVMCRSTLSVGWDGTLFDCDFNQMLGMRVNDGVPGHLRECDWRALHHRRIVTGQHCYGCTAGAGSGCGGATVCPSAPVYTKEDADPPAPNA